MKNRPDFFSPSITNIFHPKSSSMNSDNFFDKLPFAFRFLCFFCFDDTGLSGGSNSPGRIMTDIVFLT